MTEVAITADGMDAATLVLIIRPGGIGGEERQHSAAISSGWFGLGEVHEISIGLYTQRR
ncbi:hypothetical protein [Roseomonas marmotae]|uniref:Uncharacterized protein n=1 Tax=Roseomonas marmotae TaxID=2768161 RepID=A0ABS3K8E8_9PROT|nr:hypothetical protein [Roseomonas marmotae]MBO1073710.1 hypothetical protein [Roseomonas marmotae]QTI78652.1 hypothetical protein IAI58_13395 [Roseomonas marmotae]